MTIHKSWETAIPARLSNSRRLAIALALIPLAAWAETPDSPGQAYRDSPTPAHRKALERFAATHSGVPGALAHFTLGVVSFEQKQFPDAISQFVAARPGLPMLADYIGCYLAAARLETHDPVPAVRDAAAVRLAPLLSPCAAKSRVLQARALAASGSPQEAIRLLTDSYGSLPQPDGDLALATAYQAAGEGRRAADYFARVYYQHPETDAATQAAAALASLQTQLGAAYPAASPPLRVERPEQLLVAREYLRARTEFQALVPQLNGAERDQARVGVGAADYLNGDTPAAYQYLRSIEVSSPEPAAERLYYLVECARRLNDDDQMMEAVKQLNRHHADSIWRFRALLEAANRFLVTNQRDKYVPLYKAAYESFPNQPQAPACHWKVVWAAYIERKSNAAELLREHLERYPGHHSASDALYFLGRLAEFEKENYPAARAYYSRLSAQFPNYYSGIQARSRLAQPFIAAAAPSPKTLEFLRHIAFPPRPAAVVTQPDSETTLRIARAHLLRSAGLPDLAMAELRFGARYGSQPYLIAIELGRSGTSPFERLHNMKSAAPDYLSLTLEDAPPIFWQSLFPLPFQKDLERAAKQRNLDPYFLAALIRQESEFNPQALSTAKAYGLAQVRPSTGRELGKAAGVGRVTNRSLFQPSVNIRLGALYLRMLLDQYGGQKEPALAAYNAGKTHADDWLTWNRYQEPAEYVESIPFTETREYVEAVLRNAAVYRQVYAAHQPSPERPARKPASARHKPASRRTS